MPNKPERVEQHPDKELPIGKEVPGSNHEGYAEATNATVPEQATNEPMGDRGKGDKTWSPEPGEQGISNRVGDEEAADGKDDASKD